MINGLSLTNESPFDEIKRIRSDGSEYWLARELMPLMGYGADWRNLLTAVERAKLAAENSGEDVSCLFVAVTEKTSGRPREDFELARFAAYLTALNGDPRKVESAAAQSYFVIKAREAETAPALAPSPEEQMALGLVAAQKMLEQKDARIDELSRKVEADAPKLNYIELYVADSDLLRLRTVAASLGVQETWLRELLIAKGWIYVESDTRWSNSKERKETILRYSAYAEKKRYFRPVEVHEAPRFKGEVMHTLKVTPVGAEAIARLVARELAAEPPQAGAASFEDAQVVVGGKNFGSSDLARSAGGAE